MFQKNFCDAISSSSATLQNNFLGGLSTVTSSLQKIAEQQSAANEHHSQMLHQGLKTSLGLGTEQYSHLAETLKHIADDCQHLHKELQLLREESCAVNPTIIGGFLNEATSCLTKSGSDVASAVTGKVGGAFSPPAP